LPPSGLCVLAARYLTADIDPQKADHQVNIEQVSFAESAFDTILCSHVLEHVDDRKALAELYRVLRPGGLLLLMTPVVWAWAKTYENPAITTERDRLLHFGQNDHVRIFGTDIIDRIEKVGFRVSLFHSTEPAVSRHGLLRNDVLFLCGKARLRAAS